MKQDKYVSGKEKLSGIFYVLALFLITTGFAAYFMLGPSANVHRQKENIIAKMNRQKTFREDQISYSTKCDSVARKIERYNPGVSAVYEENDIKFIITEFRQTHESNPWDKRYMVFSQLADLFDMWLVAKQDLWSKKENVRLIKNNLEECQLGLLRRQQGLNN